MNDNADIPNSPFKCEVKSAVDIATLSSNVQVVTGVGSHFGCAVNSKGNIYVGDTSTHQVKVFDSEGKSLFVIGSQGSGDGQFSYPSYMAVDSQDRLYVTDYHNNRVQVFDATGKFLFKFGTNGTGDGQFNNPLGVAINSKQEVIVCDQYNHRIQVFDSNGKFLWKMGTKGTQDGCFSLPWDVAVDNMDNINSFICLLNHYISLLLIEIIIAFKY